MAFSHLTSSTNEKADGEIFLKYPKRQRFHWSNQIGIAHRIIVEEWKTLEKDSVRRCTITLSSSPSSSSSSQIPIMQHCHPTAKVFLDCDWPINPILSWATVEKYFLDEFHFKITWEPRKCISLTKNTRKSWKLSVYPTIKFLTTRTVIDIHFISIRSLTFYFSILIISMRFWRTALIEYFHMFHTIFVARILRFSQCKHNEGCLNTFWLNTWVSLQNSY